MVQALEYTQHTHGILEHDLSYNKKICNNFETAMFHLNFQEYGGEYQESEIWVCEKYNDLIGSQFFFPKIQYGHKVTSGSSKPFCIKYLQTQIGKNLNNHFWARFPRP